MLADDREAVLELLGRSFGFREIFARYMDSDPGYRPDDFLLALEDGRPISCVQLFARQIRLRGEVVRLAGIGSVATDPERRGSGLASQLIERQHERMRERGMILGLLFSDSDLYRKLGWVRIPIRELGVYAPANPPALPEGVAIRPFAPADLARVRALYDSYSGDVDGSTVRDASYWRAQLLSAEDERFEVAVRDGQLIAYARRIVQARPIVMELAHAPDEAAVAAALIVSQCPTEGELLVRVPPEAELVPALHSAAGRVEELCDLHHMWRVIDRGACARLARLPENSEDSSLLRALIQDPPAHFWYADRF